MDVKHETVEQVYRAAPAVAGTAYSAITMNEIVAIATLIYIIIQAGFLIHKWYWAIQDRKKK